MVRCKSHNNNRNGNDGWIVIANDVVRFAARKARLNNIREIILLHRLLICEYLRENQRKKNK